MEPMLWILCGAGRHVGKTYLATSLAETLPDAIYAKCGHSKPKPGRPENYFNKEADLEAFVKKNQKKHQHLVIEYNGYALAERGDVIIYIGPIPGQTDIRDDIDTLRANAHIALTTAGSIRNWKRTLRDKLKDESHSLRESILDLLVEHKAFLCRSGPSVRCKLWLVDDDLHVFGAGLARLLTTADQLGTLTEAAKENRMSYRRAWDLIKKAEKHLDRQLLNMHAGGAAGGKASLTDEGRELLSMYNQLREEVFEFAERRYTQLVTQQKKTHTNPGAQPVKEFR